MWWLLREKIVALWADPYVFLCFLCGIDDVADEQGHGCTCCYCFASFEG
jgi:hypothetical protein